MTTRLRFHAMVIMIVVIAAVLQTVVLARVGLPGGNPDLLLLAVIAVGLATGPNYGALVGFGAPHRSICDDGGKPGHGTGTRRLHHRRIFIPRLVADD